MGLLDDAIREHLELKRRRGADPAEVEKQEREALGPARGPAAGAAPLDQEPVALEPEPAPELELEPEPAAIEREPEPEPERELDLEPRTLDPEPPPPPARPPEPPAPPAPQPTEQYSVEELDDAPRAEEEPEGEDVLDETPEFLQEAPEHDRLWFEQRPPRDFDF